MDTDVYFVLGLLIAVFSIPSAISAFSDGRVPRAPAILILIGGALIVMSVNQRPGAYTFETVPDVFVQVIGRFIN